VRGGGEAQQANARKEANAERPPSPSPKGADAGLAAALLAVGPEVAETATTAGTKREELLGTATPDLALGLGNVASGLARRRAEVRALRGESAGFEGPSSVFPRLLPAAARGWTGVEAVAIFQFLPAQRIEGHCLSARFALKWRRRGRKPSTR
jgi:hypothetical protein